jgi:hypothetical protein
VSTQSIAYQQEMLTRLHLPLAVLSNDQFKPANALGLPALTIDGTRPPRRLTLILRGTVIETVFYPVPSWRRMPQR